MYTYIYVCNIYLHRPLAPPSIPLCRSLQPADVALLGGAAPFALVLLRPWDQHLIEPAATK